MGKSKREIVEFSTKKSPFWVKYKLFYSVQTVEK